MVIPALICAFAQAPVPESPLAGLIRTERAFAALAGRQSTRAAFLAYLHPQAVVFQPGPVNGRAHWEARAENPGLLTWFPAFAEVSEDGRMGYTTGPAEFRKDRAKPQEPPIWKGRFVSVWRKGADGSWRLVFDAGDNKYSTESPLAPEADARPASPLGVSAQQEVCLLERDRSQLPSTGDLAYVIASQEGFGPAGPVAGKASMRVWKKVGGIWRLRTQVETPLP